MWHTKEIAQIFIKISNEYGYSVYSDKKKCIALCGDLLVRFESEKNTLKMLFNEGLGEVLSGAPYKSNEELNMGLFRIKKFLQDHSINQETLNYIVEIVKISFVSKGVNIQENLSEPIIKMNFNDVHFKISIPVLTEFSDRVGFKFQFIGKPNSDQIDTILEKCVIIDPFKQTFESNNDYSLYKNNKTEKTEISVPYKDKKKIFISKSIMEFVFLCSNEDKIIVSYSTDSSHKLKLNKVSKYQMTDEENERYKQIINTIRKRPIGVQPIDPPIDKPIFVSQDIKEYSEALKKEILFLKLGKGKKYKIVSGNKINEDRGVYTYTFELETELHLPDDAPFIIDTADGYHAAGKVLHCEDFQIILLVDRYLNDRVSSAYLMIEPWKLLEALDNRMNSLNPNTNKLAIKLMDKGPKLSTKDDISKVPKGQKEVIKHLNNNDIVTVWGPPGTGKTFTMALIANQYIQKGKSVLIVSHSNVSVDGVIKTVVNTIDTDKQSYLKDGKILRFGFVRDEELSKHPYATAFNYALSKCPDYSKKLEELNKQREELRAKNQTKTAKYDSIEKSIKELRDQIRKEERKYVEKAQLIGTTISKATVDPMFEERQFDIVMFDEISMAYVPQVIVAAALAKDKFMCVGDFRQLSPIAQSPDAKKVLQTDIFSYLKILDGMSNMYWHPWLVMLNVQWRMHPDISRFPNKYVYRNLLEDHPSVKEHRQDIVDSNPLPGDAINLINLSGTYCAAGKDSGNSRFNILSAIVSFSTAVVADKNGCKSIGIITPYAAQTRLIRAMIHDYYDQKINSISCATVHQFQGSESDMLIFDSVESYPGNKVGFLMSKNPNEVLRLINVAITRARGKIITVSNAKFWNDNFKGTTHIFNRFLQYNQEQHRVIDQKEKELKPYIQSINPEKMIKIFTDENEALTLFEKDMERAQGKVVISIPDGELRENEAKIMDIIDDADRRGVDILMKSNNYADLPASWKRYCYGTDNATFPIIVIDDKTLWYGLPTSKLKFKIDKNTSQITVLHVMVRIKGKNTIEMIKALTNLEMTEVGDNKRLLQKRKGTAIKDGPGDLPYTLASFVKEKEFCSKCKSPMILVKNKKGTAYLKCSNKNCDEHKYLDKDLINWYITSHNVGCIKRDGGELTAYLGKYGPYIRCSCGHTLKPDEI